MLTGGCLELGADGAAVRPVHRRAARSWSGSWARTASRTCCTARRSRELARLLPELGEAGRPEDEAPGEARARLFEQVLILLEQLAEIGPVLLVIEDAHWADRSTRDLLAFLIRNQQALDGVLIVVTYRSDELHRTHPLRPLLAELDRVGWVRRMELPPADPARTPASWPPGCSATSPARTWWQRCSGAPRATRCSSRRCSGAAIGGLPESLRDLVVASVQRLPEETQDAGAGGQRGRRADRPRAAGRGHRAGPGRAGPGAAPAVAANVLLVDEDGYVFRHALIREAMHEELLPGEQQPAAQPVRRGDRRRPGAGAARPRRGRAGLSLVLGARHGRALISAWEAAAEFGRALAHAEQLAMLSRVLELWDQVPGAQRHIGADHGWVLEAAIRVAELAGEYDRGVMLAKAAPARRSTSTPNRSGPRCCMRPAGA